MPKFMPDTEVLVGKKKITVGEILKTIIYLPAEEVKSFFQEIGLTIPRELRIYVLRENLRAKVAETRKSRLTLADELNYRLSWFTEFTETQLENLLVFFDDQQINKKYLEDFWTDLLAYMVDKEVPSTDLEKIVKLSVQYVKEHNLVLPDIMAYNRGLKDLFYDSFGRIDGISPNKIRPVLYKSSTLTEIRDLGSKYDVDVPRRLKKNELADIIVSELKDKGEYTTELENQVRSMSVIVMQRFAIDHEIKASTELKKEEVIEYILKNAKETKESYFIPSSKDVYEKELDEISDEPVVVEEKVKEVSVTEPEILEEPVIVEEETPVEVEEVVEAEPEVIDEIEQVEEEIEESPKAAEKVQYVQTTTNLDALVEEIKRLRESVEKLEARPVSEKIVSEESEEKPESSIIETSTEIEPLVINSAEIYGVPKKKRKFVKNIEAKEREAFIESRKEEIIAQEKAPREPKEIPGELRALGKFFKGLFKIIGKILWKIIKFALILVAIAAVLFVLYAILTYYVNIPFLGGFDDLLNGLKISGKGILDHLHDFFQYIGI